VSEPENAEQRLTRVLDEYGRALRDAVARVCRGPLGLQRDEIEQDARIRLWRALRRETNIVDLRRYLHRIVATVAIDAMRHVRSRREVPLDSPEDDEPRGAPMPMSGGASPERIAAAREEARIARQVLTGLPDDRRRAVMLHLRGFSTEEIAGLLGWTEPKARNLVYRGVAELRAKLRPALSTPVDPPLSADVPGEVAR
jgi:RNA polymerase sigma factor (sigma-70 family)